MRMAWALIFLFSSVSCIRSEYEIPEQVKELKVIWSKQTNLIDGPSAQPLVIENSQIVYTGEIELVSLNIEDGKEVWRGIIDSEKALESRKLLYDKELEEIVSNHHEQIKIWDAEPGALKLTLGHTDGILVFRRGNNSYGYAFVGDTLDAYVINSDGSIRFTIDKPFGTSGVAYFEDKIFISQVRNVTGGLTKGKIRAFNSQTGDSLWIFETDNGGFEYANPIIQDGILYAGTIGNSPTDIAIALNAETGEVIWENEEDYFFTRNTSLGPTHFYVNTGGSLAALNKENGQLEWRVEWLATDFNKPVYLQGYVYHVRDTEMLVIEDATGEVVHRKPVPDGTFFWHIAASSDKIFVQTSNQLIAYQPWHLRD